MYFGLWEKFILKDLLPREGSILRASRFILSNSKFYDAFSRSLFLSFGENFSKIIKFRGLIQSKGILKASSVAQNAKDGTQSSSETFWVVNFHFTSEHWIMQAMSLHRKFVSLTFENVPRAQFSAAGNKLVSGRAWDLRANN